MSIGDKLSKLRQSKELTFEALSKISGVSKSHIHGIENGTNPKPSFEVIKALSSALGVRVNYFSGDESANDSSDEVVIEKFRNLEPKEKQRLKKAFDIWSSE